jgi:predicted ATPase
VRTHSPAEIDQLLREHVQVLRTPKRRERAGSSAGHHDLDAAISWSHDLLDAGEQRLFRHLAVFSASFTPDDVVELVGDLSAAECTDVLDALVDRSLVAIAPPDQRTRSSRYRMLSTLRSYARQRLAEAGDEALVRDRRAKVLAERVEAIAPRLAGPDEARWVDEIALMWKDLRSVHRRACDAGDVVLAARIVAALVHHSTMRGVEVGEWAERTLLLDGVWDQPQAPVVAGLAAEVRMRQGNPDGARQLAIETIDRVGETDPRAWLAHSTRCLMTYITGDYALGDRYQRLLHALTEGLVDTEPLAPAIAAYVGATIMIYGGQDALVEPQLQRLARVASSSGCPSIRAMSQLVEGRFRLSSDPALARSVLQDSIDLATSVANVQVTGQARWALAELSAADDPAGALAALRTLMTEFRSAGDEAQQQQALLRSLGPLVSLEADAAALLVASALAGETWGNTVLYLAGRARLAERVSPEDFEAAARRAASLGVLGVVDEVLEAIDGLHSPT